jgi:ketosteroid isomerase-like protein
MPAAEKELVDRYLAKYKEGGLDGMYACLDADFTFSDPAFPNLDGRFASFCGPDILTRTHT